jgi:hypothetical protein
MAATRVARVPGFLAPAAVLCLCLALSACPLASERPLTDPAAAILDPALAGAWQARDPDTGEWRVISFIPFDEHAYVALYAEDKARIEAYRVFSSSIGTERFLNVRELGAGGGSWNFLNYRVEAGKLVLRIVDDALFQAEGLGSADELALAVGRRLADPLLYGGGADADLVLERPPSLPATP